MSERVYGFPPCFGEDSTVLILGSFPSVKSRKVDFYYGNRQNKFWKVLCAYFGESMPETVEDKRAFLARNKVALWDIVTECEIVGSQDATIKNFKVADINSLLQNSKIRFIILNGSKAYEIFIKHFAEINVPFKKLPSTSPANTRFDEKEWRDVLSTAFGRA